MLVRFVAQNVFSFAASTEFNMLPRPKIRAHKSHKYPLPGIELLKLSAIYGANAAGKSNLVKAIKLLKDLATGSITASKVHDHRFKFDQTQPTQQILGIEFVQEETPFYYAVEVVDGRIGTEELYRSGLGKTPDVLLFERKLTALGQPQLTFAAAFEKDPKSQLLKAILLEEFLDESTCILPWLARRDNPHLGEVRKAANWLLHNLEIITPQTRPVALALELDLDPGLHAFTHATLQAYQLGISSIEVRKVPFEEIAGKLNEEELANLRDLFSREIQMKGFVLLKSSGTDELVVVKESAQLVAKHLRIMQAEPHGPESAFNLDELSDGSIRLLDFMPVFWDLLNRKMVYLVDELERSMHPNLAKALITKFSADAATQGQLIFTTHESNLLDLDIFRQDEIWFAEKSPANHTDLYSLSDFKEHHTTDIQKGYLSGRYGAIPFVSNLHDLNWHAYASL